MIERLLLWSAVASVVLAQDSSSSTESSESTSSTGGASSASETGSSTTRASFTHTIDVGLAGHTYQPDVILADAGDTIEFNFFPTNHSVIRAEYMRPCVPYEMVARSNAGKGFDSGFLPVDAILEEPPTWSLVINDTDPIFFYCGAEGSCINWQMVGVINPNSTTSLQAHKDEAERSTYMLLPGEKWPDEATDPMNSDSTSSPSSTSSSSSSSNSDSSGSGSKMSTGAIAGIAVSATIALIAAAALIFFCGRHSRQKREQNKQQQAPLMQQQNVASPDPNNFMRMSMQPYPDIYKQGSMQWDPSQSAALPGYMPQQGESQRNTYMAPMYGASEALNAGSGPNGTPQASPNMGPMPAPAYGSIVPGQLHQQQQQQGYFSPPMQPADHYHEMPAAAPSGNAQAKAGEVGELGDSSPAAAQQQQQGTGGIMSFIKQNTGNK